MFTRSGSTWTEQTILTQSDGAAKDHFGTSVALSDDGTVALVGAPNDDPTGNGSGSATVFVLTDGTWAQQQTIYTADGGMFGLIGKGLGEAVALSADGTKAIVGAPNHKQDSCSSNCSAQGSATVFTSSGGTWTEQETIRQEGGEGGSSNGSGDQFGYSVSLTDDGETAIIGIPGDNGTFNNTGSVGGFSTPTPAGITVSETSVSVAESGTTATFTVVLDSPAPTGTRPRR